MEKVPEVGDLSMNELLMVGWLPNRDEFEVEHCNDAETLVSCLDPGRLTRRRMMLKSLKLAHVELYQASSRTGRREDILLQNRAY